MNERKIEEAVESVKEEVKINTQRLDRLISLVDSIACALVEITDYINKEVEAKTKPAKW